MKRFLLCVLTLCVALGADAPLSAAEKRGKKPPRPDYLRIFPGNRNLDVHLELSGKDWDRLPGRPFTYAPCRATLDGQVFARVGIRLKGNSSSSGRSDQKSFKIDFDRFDKKTRFHGITKLNFHNGFKDPTMLREILAYGLFRQAGVPASRTAHARVFLTVEGRWKKTYLGLYTMVEQVDRRFLRDRFDDPSGSLWKGEGLAELTDWGGDPDLYGGFIQKLNENRGDLTPLLKLVKVLAQTSDNDLPERLPAVFDVVGFLRFLAVNTLLGNLDAYVGTGHNFYLYHDPAKDRITFIPWDLNEAFANFKMGSNRDMERMSIDEPFSGDKILVRRILSVPAWKKTYRNILGELLAGPFSLSRLGPQVESAWKRIREDLKKDRNKPYSFQDALTGLDEEVQGGGRHDRGGIPGLRSFAKARIQSVREQLAGTGRGIKPRGREIFRSPHVPKTVLSPACCAGKDAVYRVEKNGTLLMLDPKTLAVRGRALLPMAPIKAKEKGSSGRRTEHELLDRLDRNGDGRIDRKEWRGSSRIFQALDKNGNKVLDPDELEKLPPPPGREGRDGPDGPGRGGPGETQSLTPALAVSKTCLAVIRGGTLYRFDPSTLAPRGHNRFQQQEQQGRGPAPRAPQNRTPALALDGETLYTFDGEWVRRFDLEKLVLKADFEIPVQENKGGLFRSLDRNQDGRVDRFEFPGPPNTMRRFDRNDDGHLDEKEVRSLPPEFNRMVGRQSAQAVFGLRLLPEALLIWLGEKAYLLKKKSLKVMAERGK